MPTLNGEQRARVIDTLLQAFPRPEEMERLLDRLDRSFRAIANTGAYGDDLFKVVKAADSEGWLGELILMAVRQNQGNPALARLAEDFPTWVAEPTPISTAGAPSTYAYPWESLLEGYRERSPALQRLVRDFLLYYLGTPEDPAPFGGRTSDLARLQAWLDDPEAPPYAALVARAGMGKSTLLAHWVADLAAEHVDDLWIAYYPVSIRYSSNTEPDIFGGLAARLARLHGEPPPGVNEANLHVLYREYLDKPLPEGISLLVILDGLDEKAGQPFGETLAPTYPPPHLRFLVAARPLANDKRMDAWLRRLGWRGRRGQVFELERLDAGGLAEALHSMGDPLEHLAGDPDLVERLFTLSEGDPLLVRLYLDALAGAGDQAAWLSPAALQELDPGLEAYFEQWFNDQARLWGSDAPLHEPLVRGLLDLCASALGPLRLDDLYELGQGLFASGAQIESTAGIITRFLIGDGIERGYAFTHPRLGEHFARTHTSRERNELRGRFLVYGEQVLAELNTGDLAPEEAPEYVLRYYGAHLEQGRARTPAEAYYALMSDGWRRAWEALEGTPDGFLGDVQHAWAAARRAGPPDLGQVVRAALCFASVDSLSSNLPPELLKRAVEAGVLNLSQAEAYARRKPDPAQRFEAFFELATLNDIPADRGAILVENALSAALHINQPFEQSDALERLADRVPAEIVPRALEAVRQTLTIEEQANFFARLGSRLPQDLHAEVIDLARKSGGPYNQVEILMNLAPYLSAAHLAQVVEITYQISPLVTQAQVLINLVALMDSELRKASLQMVLTNLVNARNSESQVDTLQVLAPHLHDNLSDQALDLAAHIQNPYHRGRALAALTPRLQPDQKSLAIRSGRAMINEVDDPFEKAVLIAELAPHLAGEQRLELVNEVEDLLPRLQAYNELGYILNKLIQFLPPRLVQIVFEAAQRVGDPSLQGTLLAVLSPGLTEDMQVQALEFASQIDDSADQGGILTALADDLPPHLLEKALDIAASSEDEFMYLDFLEAVASKLPPDLLSKALDIASQVDDLDNLPDMIASLAGHLPPELLEKAIAIATQPESPYDRLNALTRLAPYLTPAQIRETFHLIYEIGTPTEVLVPAEVLAELFPYLPPDLVSQAFDVTRRVGDAEAQVGAFSGLAARLTQEWQEKLLAVLSQLQNPYVQAWTLSNLAPRFPAELMILVQEVASQIWIPTIQAGAFAQLAAFLPPQLHKEAITRLTKLDRPDVQTESLVALKPHLARDMQTYLKEQTGSLADPAAKARILANLSQHLSAEEAGECILLALNSASEIISPFDRASVMLELYAYLPESQQQAVLTQCIGWMRELGYPDEQAELITKAAPDLPANLLSEAYEITMAMEDRSNQADALVALAPFLPESLLNEAFDMAAQMDDPYSQSKVLAGLAPYLKAEKVQQVFDHTLLIDKYHLADVLFGLAPYLLERQLRRVLETLTELDDYDKAEVISILAPYLKAKLKGKAFEAIDTISPQANQIVALAGMIPCLPASQAKMGLERAFEIFKEVGKPLHAWEALLSLLSPRQLAETLPLLSRMLAETTLDRVPLLEVYARQWTEICQAAGQPEHEAFSDLLEKLAPSGRARSAGGHRGLCPGDCRPGG